jgi:hypothetical protein
MLVLNIRPKFGDGYVLCDERTIQKLTVPVVQTGKVEIQGKSLIYLKFEKCPFFQNRADGLRILGKLDFLTLNRHLLSHDSHRQTGYACGYEVLYVKRAFLTL